MIYLQSFQMPTMHDEENYFVNPGNFKGKRTCYTTKYPVGDDERAGEIFYHNPLDGRLVIDGKGVVATSSKYHRRLLG